MSEYKTNCSFKINNSDYNEYTSNNLFTKVEDYNNIFEENIKAIDNNFNIVQSFVDLLSSNFKSVENYDINLLFLINQLTDEFSNLQNNTELFVENYFNIYTAFKDLYNITLSTEDKLKNIMYVNINNNNEYNILKTEYNNIKNENELIKSELNEYFNINKKLEKEIKEHLKKLDEYKLMLTNNKDFSYKTNYNINKLNSLSNKLTSSTNKKTDENSTVYLKESKEELDQKDILIYYHINENNNKNICINNLEKENKMLKLDLKKSQVSIKNIMSINKEKENEINNLKNYINDNLNKKDMFNKKLDSTSLNITNSRSSLNYFNKLDSGIKIESTDNIKSNDNNFQNSSINSVIKNDYFISKNNSNESINENNTVCFNDDINICPDKTDKAKTLNDIINNTNIVININNNINSNDSKNTNINKNKYNKKKQINKHRKSKFINKYYCNIEELKPIKEQDSNINNNNLSLLYNNSYEEKTDNFNTIKKLKSYNSISPNNKSNFCINKNKLKIKSNEVNLQLICNKRLFNINNIYPLRVISLEISNNILKIMNDIFNSIMSKYSSNINKNKSQVDFNKIKNLYIKFFKKNPLEEKEKNNSKDMYNTNCINNKNKNIVFKNIELETHINCNNNNNNNNNNVDFNYELYKNKTLNSYKNFNNVSLNNIDICKNTVDKRKKSDKKYSNIKILKSSESKKIYLEEDLI